jgi:hypothetical protein
MPSTLRGSLFCAALAASAVASAAGPSSASFELPASAVDAGIGAVASPTFRVSSSLGGAFHTGAMGSAGIRLDPGYQAAVSGLANACLLDVDGNGTVDALTDGLMILRAMFGLTGASVTNGAVGTGATRTTWAAVQPMIHYPALDLDGNGATDALTDGLILLRAMFGLTGAAATNGALGQGASRAGWADIRAYLNARCGTNFGP